MKIAPLLREQEKYSVLEPILVHTGQHYDAEMSQVFFDDLKLPYPDLYLGVGSASHGRQTAQVMISFEEVVETQKPDLVVVVGDVNSTLACALVAAKLRIPLAHVEAGLRSFDRTMPEEINRLVTDTLSDLLFTTCEDADQNLLREGIPQERIYFVGNVMVDTLLSHRVLAEVSTIRAQMGLGEKPYALLTLHRPSNVDKAEVLAGIMEALRAIQRQIPIVFPVHPRTRANLARFGLGGGVAGLDNVLLLDPLGYLDFVHLMAHARFVLTDSGGIQEETTVLGVPCLTLRENTERPITITQGTNTLVGNDPARIVAAGEAILKGEGKQGRIPALWDGKAAERILTVIKQRFALTEGAAPRQ